jgi:hypothetical protein
MSLTTVVRPSNLSPAQTAFSPQSGAPVAVVERALAFPEAAQERVRALCGKSAVVKSLRWTYANKSAQQGYLFDINVVHPVHGIVVARVLNTGGKPVVIRSKNAPAFTFERGIGFSSLTSPSDCPMQSLSLAARSLAMTLRPLFTAFDVTRPRCFDPARLASDADGIRELETFFHPVLLVTPGLATGSYWPMPHPENDWLPVTVLGVDDLISLLTAPSSAPPAFYPDEIAYLRYCLGEPWARAFAAPLPVAC